MAHVAIEADQLVVRLSGLEKLGAIHGDVVVPLGAVRGVRAVERPISEIRGIRAPGAAWPGFRLGTWRRRRSKDFVAVRRGEPGVVVELDPSTSGFGRLVLSTPNASELVEAIEQASGA